MNKRTWGRSDPDPRDTPTVPSVERPTFRQLRVSAFSRARRGLHRTRTDLWPILTAAGAAGIAYAIALYGLGHRYPMFAAIAAFISLGFSHDRRPRKVAELAFGVAIGVLFGEVFTTLFGTGPVQIAVVLVLAVTVARLIDAGQMLAMQAGVQSVVVVALPAHLFGVTGALDRWLDAMIGGAVALAVAALLPIDVRKQVRSLARAALLEISRTLSGVARGIAARDGTLVADALVQARGSQAVLDEWHKVVRGSLAATRFTPTWLRHDDEMTRLDRAAMLCDRAMRNTRVLTRRANVAFLDGPDGALLADLLEQTAAAAARVGGLLGSNEDPAKARRELVGIAGQLDPQAFADWRGQTEVALLRSLLVDLLEITGWTGDEARAVLPKPGAQPS